MSWAHLFLIMGGGGTMKKLAIASLLIQICMLIIAFIDLLFK